MTTDDDLLKEQGGDSVTREVASTVSSDSEELAQDIAGGGIAKGEVRVVAIPPEQSSSNSLLIVLVLLVLLIGAGYLLLSSGLLTDDFAGQARLEPQRHAIPARPEVDKLIKEEIIPEKPVAAVSGPEPTVVDKSAADPPPQVAAIKTPAEPEVTADVPLYHVLLGPFLTTAGSRQAYDVCVELGVNPKKTRGEGMVNMVRLLEGIYPKAEARERLKELKKKVKTAFVLPAGDKLAIYTGSFYDSARAQRETENLAKKNIRVSPLATKIKMKGDMLIAVQADKQTAERIAMLIKDKGVRVQVVRQ